MPMQQQKLALATDVVFQYIFALNELTRSIISVSHCTALVLGFIPSGSKLKVEISSTFQTESRSTVLDSTLY